MKKTIDISVSLREKIETIPLKQYLDKRFAFPVESVFGFLEPSTLYGGRAYELRQISEADAEQIKLRIPLSNHFATRDEYEENEGFLNKYHKPGNAVIIVNNDLAKWIKQDFPLYEIEASAIKNINSLKKINKLPSDYDSYVIPAMANDDMSFLQSIPDKDRARLFLNAGCAYTCPAKICYKSISTLNKGRAGRFKCSQPLKPRELKGVTGFDKQIFIDMGFSRFKVLTPKLKTQNDG
jgi:hypothetical protein